MSSMLPVLRMVAQRSLGHWRLFLAMTLGAVVAAALMASVVLYSDAVRDLGLKHALSSQPEFATDVAVIGTSQRLGPQELPQTLEVRNTLLDQHIADLQTDRVQYIRSATFFPTDEGGAVSEDEQKPRAHLQAIERVEEHVGLVEGEPLPAGTTLAEDGGPILPAWIGREAAEANGLGVGDVLDLHPHWREVVPVHLQIVGIINQTDPEDPYWFGRTDRFVVDTSWPTYPFFVTEQALSEVATYLPDMDGTVETYSFIDTSRVNSTNDDDVEARVGGLRQSVQSQLALTYVDTELDTTITAYQERLFFTRLPLFALMIQVTGIVLFYLVMVSTMVVDRQAGEIALLKSRGASTRQVMLVFLAEGLGIAIIATVIGPLFAVGAISILGLTPPFEPLSGGDLLDVPVNYWAFLLAAIGGLMSLVALLVPAYKASKLSITNYKQQVSRPQTQPLFFRYYLDLAVVAVAAFAFYQLRQRGSFVTDKLFGDLSADPILLATPSLFMLMVALVFLRLFPLALKLVLLATSRLRGPTAALALTRMARSPLQHSRLILLLILSTAVGMFAAGFRATLEQGYEDRAAYRAGSELRFSDIRQPTNLPPDLLASELGTTMETREPSPAIRMNGYYSASRFESRTVTLLGVDREEFPQVAYWRDDFGAASMDSLLSRLDQEPFTAPEAQIIPPGSRLLGVWLQTPLVNVNAPMGIRLRGADDTIWEFRLGTEGEFLANTWQFFVADLTRPTSIRPGTAEVPPPGIELRFDGFFVALPGAAPQVAQPVTVVLDDLQASPSEQLADGWGKAGFSDGTVIETFETIENYELTKGISSVGDPGQLSRGPAPEGRDGYVARLSFIRGRGGSPLVAFRSIRDSRPVPVVASEAFLDAAGLNVGDEVSVFINSQYATFRIAGTFELFPTYDPKLPEGLFVAERQSLREAAVRVPGAGTNIYPNEAWFPSRSSLPLDDDSLNDLGLRAEGVFDRVTILEEQSSDPLIAASWEGILFLCLAAVILISALGFGMYSGLGALARSLEFAILRTMGLSGRQIFGVVTFEQVFVVVAGITTGTLLGFPLSRLMISYMGLTERGEEPLPPLVSVVSWEAVVTVWGLLALVVASSVAVLVALYSRLAVSRALRMGEL